MRRARSMKVAVAPFALTLLLALPAPGSTAPVCTDQAVGLNERCPTWAAAYNHTGRGGRGEDVGRDLAVSPDGATVYVTGQSRDDQTGDDQAVVAYDAATGAQRWASRYTTQGPSFDTGSALTVSPDGGTVFVVGRSVGADGSFDWITAAYDAATGQRAWAVRHASPDSDRTWAVATSPDGTTVYVVGEVNGGDIGAVAYDAETGDERWASVYDNSGAHELALQVAVSPEGETLYAAGVGGAPGRGMDLVAVAFRTVEEGPHDPGTVRWVRHADGGSRVDETFAGFDLSPDGASLAIAGFTNVAGVSKALTVVMDPVTAEERWRALHDAFPGDSDLRNTIAVGGGRVIRVARVTPDVMKSLDYLTLAYDADDGSLVWSAVEGSPEPLMKDIGKTVAMSPDGTRAYVSGYTVFPYGETNGFRFEPGHIMTVSYNAATGQRRWIARHNQSGVGSDFGLALVPSPDGSRVFLGGTFITSGVRITVTDLLMGFAYDFGTVAYPA